MTNGFNREWNAIIGPLNATPRLNCWRDGVFRRSVSFLRVNTVPVGRSSTSVRTASEYAMTTSGSSAKTRIIVATLSGNQTSSKSLRKMRSPVTRLMARPAFIPCSRFGISTLPLPASFSSLHFRPFQSQSHQGGLQCPSWSGNCSLGSFKFRKRPTTFLESALGGSLQCEEQRCTLIPKLEVAEVNWTTVKSVTDERAATLSHESAQPVKPDSWSRWVRATIPATRGLTSDVANKNLLPRVNSLPRQSVLGAG